MEDAPAQFSPEDMEGHRQLVAEARSRLREAGMTETELSDIWQVLDFENDGPYFKAPFAFGSGEFAGQHAIGNSVSHMATACYLFTDALRSCGWYQSERAGAINYHTNTTAKRRLYGVEPFHRATPYWIPGALDGRTECVSGYWIGGPSGCFSEAEMMDVIRDAPGPLVLVLEDNQPGLFDLLRAAKESGKVPMVLLWGSGYRDGDTEGDRAWRRTVGKRHREKGGRRPDGSPDEERSGDAAWMRLQDAAIWQAANGTRSPAEAELKRAAERAGAP